MHYTGTIWRPPYEAGSLLLEVTAGCTHHRCKFCTLYEDLPFRFRVTPMETVEADLQEAQLWANDPLALLSARLQDLPRPAPAERVFLVGANPFVLSARRLAEIAGRIRAHFPACQSVGCFARVTDVAAKSDEDLARLRALGFDGLTIGAETGDDETLAFMDKGFTSQDLIRQAARLDQAGISYHFTYLAGLSGAGRGRHAALESAVMFNRTHPRTIGSSMLTVYPGARLMEEIRAGRWAEAPELEKLEELRVLLQHLEIPVYFATLGVSNAVQVQGRLPQDRAEMLRRLAPFRRPDQETALRAYRENLPHL